MESAESSAQALYDADGSRQGAEKDHDGDRTRTVGLYLGHRDQGRSGLQATNGGMKGTERTNAKNHPNDSKMLTGSHHIRAYLTIIRWHVSTAPGVDHGQLFHNLVSHYGVTGSMR